MNLHVLNVKGREYSLIDSIFILLFPTIVNLPAAISSGGRFLTSAVLWLVVLKNIPFAQLGSRSVLLHNERFRKNFWIFAPPLVVPLVFFLFLVLLADVRGGFNGFSTPFSYLGQFFWMITILLFSYSTIVRVSNERQFATMVTMLVAGFGLLIALNVALVAVGMRGVEVSAEDGPNKILSLVGLNVQRIRSPLSGGLNNFAAISGLTFAMGLSLARVSRGFRRFLGIAVSLLGLVGLVLADSRAVIASSFLAIFVCVVLTRSASVRRLSPNAIYFLPFLPVLFVLVFPVLQESGALRWLQREGTFAAKIGVTSGRDIIWSAIVDVAKDWNPIQVVGYGAYGQVLSGAAKDYSWIFSELGSGSGKSTHNAALQIFIDLGYLGLAIWLIWLSRLIRMIVGQIEFGVGASGGAVRAGYLYPVLIGVVLILLCGLTEVSGTIYYPDIFSFLLISSIWLPGVCALRELTRNE